MRITHGMMSDRLLTDVRRQNAEIARTTAQVTSGKRIQTASDDAVGTGKALRLRNSLEETNASIASAGAAQDWTTSSMSALDQVGDIVHKTRELIVQAGNDTLKPADREQIGKQLSQLLEQVKVIGNTKVGDAYIFAGQDSANPPYAAGASDAYSGDNLAVVRSIGPGQSVQVNAAGGDIFGSGGGDGKLLDTMRNAIAFLNGGTAADANNLRTTTLAALNTNLDQVLTANATIGATQSRITLAVDRLEDTKLAVTSQLTNVEDADYAESLIQLSSQKTAYQAALNAGAQVIQPSLMDFLR